MYHIWTWFKEAADRLMGSMDNGSFFSKPWHWVYSLLGILTGAAGALGGIVLFFGGFAACFKLCANGRQHFGVEAAEAGILLALAQLATGLFIAGIWWGRRKSLARHTGGGRVFITAPTVAHLVRTCGEVAGVSMAVGTVLFFLASWPFSGMNTQALGGEWAGTFIRMVRLPMQLPIPIPHWGVAQVRGLVSALLAPVAAYLLILLTRWVAECIEVFFAIANNTRMLREPPPPTPAAPFSQLSVDGLTVLAGILCYFLIAFPLHQWYVVLPAGALLYLAFRKKWTITATLLVAVMAIVLLRSLFEVVAGGDPDSIAQVFVNAGVPLHIFLFLLVLAAICMIILEGSGRSEMFLTRTRIWSIGIGIALLHSLLPAIRTVADAHARHTLTGTESTTAQELFKAYEGRAFAWRYSGHLDTTRTFTIGAPEIRADRYGMITVDHELPFEGRTLKAEFKCSYKAISLPESLTYTAPNVRAEVAYMHGDSISFQELPNGEQRTAVAMDAVHHRHERKAQRARLLFTAYRDSLNHITDTLEGAFISRDCMDTTCYAWFDVERPEGRERRSFYCPAATVSGYPVGALPKDGTAWTIITRETAFGTEDAMTKGSGPVVYELVGLHPVMEATPAPAPAIRVAPAPAQQTPTALPKPPPPQKKAFSLADVDQEARFPGGRAALIGYLGGRKYPPEEKAAGITGKVRVAFIVGRDGTVRDARIERSPGYARFDQEALRIVRAMPRWTPASKGGSSVAMRKSVTVDFSLNR